MEDAARDTQKVSVRIWKPLLVKLDQKLERACLRRDAYLARVLAVEIPALDEEVCLPNSVEAQARVAQQLDDLDRKPVSLALPSELMSQLNAICARKRIVRDAFFNRLFLLLAAKPKAIDNLLFPFAPTDWRTAVWTEYKHDGPFFTNGFYPLEQDVDPFWAIRAGLDLYEDKENLELYPTPENPKAKVIRDIVGFAYPRATVYTTVLTQNVDGHSLIGLNCYLPDTEIPGHPEEQKRRATLDAILAEL